MPPLPISKSLARRRLPDDVRGTVSIEFAILMPVFFAILFGIIVFGVQYATRIALTYAAAEGGRAAVAGLNDGERQTLATNAITNALNALSPLVNPAKATISVNLARENSSEEITISIAYNDTRFAELPFVPQLGNLAPVTVSYYVTDPSG
ncbi:MAG TPA: TadE/TadG family type IV pilus assembly protein [Devosia sp.]|nr:TadE/TadG family type IV pilus assembly protein [Devosia sp.]